MDSMLIAPLLHERDAAKVLAVSPAWLQRERWKRTGPDYIKHGRAVRYELEALTRWIADHRKSPSAPSGPEGK